MLSEKEIEREAFNWAVDYKPWDETLRPQDYAKYGYQEGYKQAQRDLLKKLGLTQIEESL